MAFTWTLTVDPLTTLLGFVHVQVEHRAGQYASIYVGPSLKLINSPLGIANGDYKGYGVEAGVRVFPWGKSPTGPWVMTRAVLADIVEASDVPGQRGGSEAGAYTSLLVGYTGIVPVGPAKKTGLVLSGGLGLSYFDYGPDPSAGGIHGFLPAAHTNIGWAF